MLLCSSVSTSINSEIPRGFSDSGASGPPGFAATATIGHPENLKERKRHSPLDHRSPTHVNIKDFQAHLKARKLPKIPVYLFFPHLD